LFAFALKTLQLLPGKKIRACFLNTLVAQSRESRLNFLAGCLDADGSNAHEKTFGVRALSLSQSVQNTAVNHSGILTAYAVVAQSLGLDARRCEAFSLAHRPSLDENGQVLRGDDARPLDDVHKELNYARERNGTVLISGAATEDIPLKVTKTQ